MTDFNDEKLNWAHHGLPILTERELKICLAMSQWIATARKFGGSQYGPDWSPSQADIVKSRLFWRLRSGKEPLVEPPPRCFSCPWYEVVENPEPHWCFEGYIVAKQGIGVVTAAEIERLKNDFLNKAVIGQCAYDIIEEHSDGTYILGFNCWRFKGWHGANEHARNGFFLQCLNPPQ